MPGEWIAQLPADLQSNEAFTGYATLGDFAKEAAISSNNAGVRLHRARRALEVRVRDVCTTCADHGCHACTCTPEPAKAASTQAERLPIGEV